MAPPGALPYSLPPDPETPSPASTRRTMKKPLLLTFLCLFGPAITAAAQEGEARAPKKLDEKVYEHFGAGITEGTAPIALEDLMKDPAAHTGKTIRVAGPITAVCQTKGCWMHLGKPLANGNPPVFVKFKDYAFFVPKDASGRTAVLEGVMTMKQETVEQTRHYLEDEGKIEEAKKVTEGRKLFHFMADGVAIKKPGKLDEKRFDHFGAGIVEGPAATPLADVLAKPEQFTGKTVRIEAPITAVCQTKGCWMHLGAQQPPVMVKFQDYAFFVPKDATGRKTIVEGTMSMKQETVEQTRHYLEDEGKVEEAKKVTEGRKLYHFMATGVAIEKPAKTEKDAK
jgi:hypothetical protein